MCGYNTADPSGREVNGRSLAGIAGSNLDGGMAVSCECWVLSGRGLSVGLITRPEESYRVWCVWVWSWSLDNEKAADHDGLLRHGIIVLRRWMFQFKNLCQSQQMMLQFNWALQKKTLLFQAFPVTNLSFIRKDCVQKWSIFNMWWVLCKQTVSAIRDSHILNTWYYVRNSVVWAEEKFQSGARTFFQQLCCLFGILGVRSPQSKDLVAANLAFPHSAYCSD